MDFLIDTHIALWLMNDDQRLTEKAKEIVTSKKNNIYYSVVSMWEVAIKKMAKPDSINVTGTEFMHICERSGFKKLELDDRHIVALETLNPKEGCEELHKDPFDKMLLSQAKADCMTLLTHDKKFENWNEPYYFVV